MRRGRDTRGRYLRLVCVLSALFALFVPPTVAWSAPGETVDFPIPREGSEPWGITAGPDGNLWFTETLADKIGRITPSGQMTEFSLPRRYPENPAESQPEGIAAGPDGDLWFTESVGGKIGRITPDGRIISEYPTLGGNPTEIALGPDGDMWFTERTGAKIDRISPGGQIMAFPLPDQAGEPRCITSGPDGNLWFTIVTKQNPEGMIGRITPSGQITEFALPRGGGAPLGITSGPDGDLWFTANISLGFEAGTQGMIGRITPSGQIKEFALPREWAYPRRIVAGPDGHLWFTAPDSGDRGFWGGGIDAITPSGHVTGFETDSSLAAFGITNGPDGNLWFTASGMGGGASYGPGPAAVGRISPGLITVSIAGKRVVASRRWVRVPLECASGNLACHGVLRLRMNTSKRPLVAHCRYTLPSQAMREVSLRLTGRAMALLSAQRRLRVQATVTVENGEAESKSIVLSLPQKAKAGR